MLCCVLKSHAAIVSPRAGSSVLPGEGGGRKSFIKQERAKFSSRTGLAWSVTVIRGAVTSGTFALMSSSVPWGWDQPPPEQQPRWGKIARVFGAEVCSSRHLVGAQSVGEFGSVRGPHLLLGLGARHPGSLGPCGTGLSPCTRRAHTC